jgi:glycosyltransferase involved in cell wall biosynthesis
MQETRTAPQPLPDPGEDYLFRFDAPLEPIVFGGEVALHGWLLHREEKPTLGIRALVRRRFHKRQEFRARRKRNRPEVAAAFPDTPGAMASGFLLELRLGLGRNNITFQVLDHDRVWRTFHSASAVAVPLVFADRLGLSNLRIFLLFYLRQFLSRSASRLGHSSPPPCRLSAELRQSPHLAAEPPSPLRTRRVNLFATSKSNLFIIEIAELAAAGFREIGCEAALLLDELPEETPPEDTLQIIVTPHEYYNLFLSEMVDRRRARQLTREAILLCTEQPETHWFESNLRWAIYARGVADINPLGVMAYRARGLRCQLLHLGHHSILADRENVPHRARDIDITFLGSLTPRRDQFFAEAAPFFSTKRCHLRLVPLGFAKTKLTKSYLSIERRNELLSQTKILLNVHYSDQKYFEWHRMLVGLANGCCIITETCSGYGALVPGKHFIMTEPEYLIPCCEYYLAHPDECEEIARQGLEFIQKELRQDQACRAFLQEVEADAVRELERSDRDDKTMPVVMANDAPPHPLPPELTRLLSEHSGRLLWRAVADDFRNAWKRLSKSLARIREKPRAKPLSEKEVRKEVINRRKNYQSRWLEQEAASVKNEPFFQLHENEAFTRCGEPKLSVIITLYNYAHFIEDCVASVSVAGRKFAQSLEVLIVNDASTDSSLAQALRCLKKFDLPIRIVDKKWNTGLADARNIGVSTARAPYVFILDADNLIYPDALRQLFEAISKGDHAAAFSMLCRFRGTPAKRVGLLSYFDWDPQILVQYPYIDAMAVFRRDALLEAPGYDNELNQIGWFGWEDYDMWLRFAQKHDDVAFVPNILCLYRHHDTSMINTTNLFELDLVHHLIEKYGDLVERFEPRERLFGVDRNKIRLAKKPLSAAALRDVKPAQSSVTSTRFFGL